MEEIITALIGGLCVAVPNIIATISGIKKNNIEKVKGEIKGSIKDTEKSIKADITKVKKSLDDETLSRCKVDLINVMSRV